MQNLIIKRKATIMLEDYSFDDSLKTYQNPRKKYKKTLQIEITDSFSEAANHQILIEHQPNNSTSYKPTHSFNLLTLSSDSFYQPSTSPRTKSEVSLRFNHEREPISEIDRKYDDYYVEDDCFNVYMQKCNRKTMEDRVILTYSIIFNIFILGNIRKKINFRFTRFLFCRVRWTYNNICIGVFARKFPQNAIKSPAIFNK